MLAIGKLLLTQYILCDNVVTKPTKLIYAHSYMYVHSKTLEVSAVTLMTAKNIRLPKLCILFNVLFSFSHLITKGNCTKHVAKNNYKKETQIASGSNISYFTCIIRDCL